MRDLRVNCTPSQVSTGICGRTFGFVAALTMACAACGSFGDAGGAASIEAPYELKSGDGADEERVGEAADEIQGGYGAASDTAVVGLALRDESGRVVRTCSGALIAPNLVLTAQHCVATETTFVDCANSGFAAPVPAERLDVTTSPSMWSADAAWYSAARIEVPHAEENDVGASESLCGYDFALVVLRTPVPANVATPLTPRLESNPSEGESYSAVGYGDDGDGVSGIRRKRDDLAVMCVGAGCEEERVDGREWRGDSGICKGDSGGPAVDGNGRVLGVTSRGPAGCANAIYGSVPSWGSWIQRVGVSAANDGGYAPPAWTDAKVAEAASELSSEDWTSCSAADVGRAGGAGRTGAVAIAAVVGLAAALGARGRRRAA